MNPAELRDAEKKLSAIQHIDRVLAWKPTKEEPGPQWWKISSGKDQNNSYYLGSFDIEEVMARAVLTSMRNKLAGELAALGVST